MFAVCFCHATGRIYSKNNRTIPSFTKSEKQVCNFQNENTVIVFNVNSNESPVFNWFSTKYTMGVLLLTGLSEKHKLKRQILKTPVVVSFSPPFCILSLQLWCSNQVQQVTYKLLRCLAPRSPFQLNRVKPSHWHKRWMQLFLDNSKNLCDPCQVEGKSST